MNEKEKISEVEHILDGDLELQPSYGDLFSLEDFIEYCRNGMFIDYDGSGTYATATMISKTHDAIPSEIKDGKIDRSWTHVMWFNR